jgi:aminomethyltransferase
MDTEPRLKITPLFAEHVRLGGKIVGFGGWNMPVQYTGIIEEHQAVRNGLGVFDISHMGQLIVSGSAAAKWLNFLLTNNIDRLPEGGCHYTFLLNERGGVIDDLIVYRQAPDEFLLVVNASKTEEDLACMRAHLRDGVKLQNRSADFAGLAIQGPKSAALFDACFAGAHSLPARNEIKEVDCEGLHFHIARTGYTGEDGFEIFFPADHAIEVWNKVLNKGASLGIRPCGLGARDTLRLEMCYPLNGNDLSPEHTPLEAGLGIFVDFAKGDFIGRDFLLRQKEKGVERKLVPFRMKEKGPPPRPHYALFKGADAIGEVTSGTLSPSLGIGIGMGYVPAEYARIGEAIAVDIRGRRFPAQIEKRPLYRRPT